VSDLTARLKSLNPRLEVYEVVTTDGDYSVVIGKLGEEDNPHYLICNMKYGVIEAGTGALAEVPRLFEMCLGRPATKKDITINANQKDLWN
jgi:hypothetical protein